MNIIGVNAEKTNSPLRLLPPCARSSPAHRAACFFTPRSGAEFNDPIWRGAPPTWLRLSRRHRSEESRGAADRNTFTGLSEDSQPGSAAPGRTGGWNTSLWRFAYSAAKWQWATWSREQLQPAGIHRGSFYQSCKVSVSMVSLQKKKKTSCRIHSEFQMLYSLLQCGGWFPCRLHRGPAPSAPSKCFFNVAVTRSIRDYLQSYNLNMHVKSILACFNIKFLKYVDTNTISVLKCYR